MRRIGAVIVLIYRVPALLAKRMCILMIRGYQRASRYKPRVCKFEPTCSEYTLQAIQKYGVLRGIVMGCWRILRCNPFSQGGNDPVK